MEKRLPLALALSVLFVMLMQQLWPRSAPVEGVPVAPAPVSAASVETAGAPGGHGPVPADAGAGPVAEAPLREETLTGENVRSLWTSRGAALRRLELLDFHPRIDDTDPLPLLDELDGSPSLLLRDVGGQLALDRVSWDVARPAGPAGGAIEFQHRTAGGLVFTKRVAPSAVPYLHDLALEVRNEGSERLPSLSLVLQGARGLVDLEPPSQFFGQPTAVALLRDDVGEEIVLPWRAGDLRGAGRSIGEREALLGAGTMSNYFAAMLLPQPGTDVRQVLPVAVEDRMRLERMVDLAQPRDGRDADRRRAELRDDVPDAAATEVQFLVLGLEPGQTQEFRFQFFAGPKRTQLAGHPELAFIGPLIESGYGWGAWINHTLLVVLRFLHDLVGNWGVAIILLTVIVRGVLFPLNRRQQSSMARYAAVMQRVKPQLDELKARHKSNPRKFQEEQMKLLREHGATPPLGGCLLMLLQFPVWISLFNILGSSIELRQSSFAGWIDDLSRPDAMPAGLPGFPTVNLLPILMAAATIIQMRVQPKPVDPQQAQTQKIMGTIMPLLMLWFLYGYSAGLSLYILTSSLLGILEYQVIRKLWPIDASAPRFGWTESTSH